MVQFGLMLAAITYCLGRAFPTVRIEPYNVAKATVHAIWALIALLLVLPCKMVFSFVYHVVVDADVESKKGASPMSTENFVQLLKAPEADAALSRLGFVRRCDPGYVGRADLDLLKTTTASGNDRQAFKMQECMNSLYNDQVARERVYLRAGERAPTAASCKCHSQQPLDQTPEVKALVSAIGDAADKNHSLETELKSLRQLVLWRTGSSATSSTPAQEPVGSSPEVKALQTALAEAERKIDSMVLETRGGLGVLASEVAELREMVHKREVPSADSAAPTQQPAGLASEVEARIHRVEQQITEVIWAVQHNVINGQLDPLQERVKALDAGVQAATANETTAERMAALESRVQALDVGAKAAAEATTSRLAALESWAQAMGVNAKAATGAQAPEDGLSTLESRIEALEYAAEAAGEAEVTPNRVAALESSVQKLQADFSLECDLIVASSEYDGDRFLAVEKRLEYLENKAKRRTDMMKDITKQLNTFQGFLEEMDGGAQFAGEIEELNDRVNLLEGGLNALDKGMEFRIRYSQLGECVKARLDPLEHRVKTLEGGGQS